MRSILFFALVAGCSFPEPTINDISTSGDSSSGDSSNVDSAMTDSKVFLDSMLGDSGGDAAVTDSELMETPGDTKTDVADATDAKLDISSCKGDPFCDCDGDGDNIKGKSTCSPVGNDCDDGDARRNSKVTDFQDYSLTSPIVVTHDGDWDCSGVVTKQYAIENINCGSYLNISGCTQQGYKTTAICGTTNTLVQCKPGPVANCVEGGSTVVTVKCK